MKRRCAATATVRELLKHRDFLLEQQNVLKKIEADVEIMGDRTEALADEIERLNGLSPRRAPTLRRTAPRIWRRRRSRSPRSRS